MAHLTVNINADSSAFDNDNGTEIARLLRKLADDFEGGNIPESSGRLLDTNGNTTGTWVFTEDD